MKYVPMVLFTYEPNRHQFDDHESSYDYWDFAFSTFKAITSSEYSRWFTFVFGKKQIDINVWWYR